MMHVMGTENRRRAAWVAVGMAVAAAIGLSLVAGVTPTVPPRGTDSPYAPVPSTPAVGPVVYSEVIDAEGSALIERRLDGSSLPRRVAVLHDVDAGRTWSVDPRGLMAVALVPGRGSQRLQAIAIADGAELWQLDVPIAQLDEAAWSADGRRIGVLSRPVEAGPVEAFVLDARNGHLVRTIVPEGAVIQAFDAEDALVLRQRVDEPGANAPSWRFFRIDPATNVVEQLGTPPVVGPAAGATDDTDPAHGLGVVAAPGPNDEGTAIKAFPLVGGGASRTLAVMPSVDRLAIDPTGSGVAVSTDQGIRFVTWDGRATDLWTGDDPVVEFGWSAGGDYLGVETDRRGANLTIVERATGRAVAIPQADPVAASILVRIVGGVPLPQTPLPAAEPTPIPTPAPSGADVGAGSATLASAWLETGNGRLLLHVDRLVPTESGGMRISGSMTPIDLGPAPDPDEGRGLITLLPRPGSPDVLAWVQLEDQSRGWLWDGRSGPGRPLALPADWPVDAADVAWRPDGGALAASAGQSTPRAGFDGIFAVADVGGRRTVTIPITGDYDRLEGWWSPTELRVGYKFCTEGCSGRHSFSARLRVRDGHLTQLTPADRTRAAIDDALPDGGRGMVLSAINDDPADDIHIDWPPNPDSPDGPVPIGFTAGGRALLVVEETATGTDLYRVDDPAGRAVHGRLVEPAPARLGHLAGGSLDVRVSPDAAWAITVDRVEEIRLVELATGRAWGIDHDRTLAWWPPG